MNGVEINLSYDDNGLPTVKIKTGGIRPKVVVELNDQLIYDPSDRSQDHRWVLTAAMVGDGDAVQIAEAVQLYDGIGVETLRKMLSDEGLSCVIRDGLRAVIAIRGL